MGFERHTILKSYYSAAEKLPGLWLPRHKNGVPRRNGALDREGARENLLYDAKFSSQGSKSWPTIPEDKLCRVSTHTAHRGCSWSNILSSRATVSAKVQLWLAIISLHASSILVALPCQLTLQGLQWVIVSISKLRGASSQRSQRSRLAKMGWTTPSGTKKTCLVD